MKTIVLGAICLFGLGISTRSGLAQAVNFTIHTVAGNVDSSGFGKDGDPAASIQVYPNSPAVDSAGNLFILDGEYLLRKVTAGGLISTFDLGDWSPVDVAVDTAGILYITDNYSHVVYKVTPGGVISIFAGKGGAAGFGGDGGLATSAMINRPVGVAVDTVGNVFIADYGNHRVRRITPDGVMSTVAGNGELGFSGDEGLATSARLNYPHAIAVDGTGNLYIADRNDRVRMVTRDGLIHTVAGNGLFGFSGDGGPATTAQLNFPYGIAVDAAGNLYIADNFNHRVRMVDANGVIRTIAGDGTAGFSGDGGPATSAQLHGPAGIALDAAGDLYIADIANHRIRKLRRTSTGSHEPVALKRDFNGDDKTDILWRDPGGNLSMWLMNGYSITTESLIGSISTDWTVVGSGDFNGDGKADILWRNDKDGNVATWLMDGTTKVSHAYPGNMPLTWRISAIADFDADGMADILWRDRSGNILVWLMNGHRIAISEFIGKVWTGWSIVTSDDFNGDGKADILWRDASGTVAVWLMDGTTVASYKTIGDIWLGWSIAGVGDVSGDAKADVLWRDNSGNLAIWLMDGTTISSASELGNIWMGWSIAGVGDFSGDGKADILWRDASGNTAVWLMDGTAVSSYSETGNVSDRKAQ